MNQKTEKIRLIVCDIDNTIIPAGRDAVSQRLRDDFRKAMDRGIRIMIDTGRHYTFLQPSLFEDLPMEYIGTINGACLTDREGHVLKKTPMREETMRRITENCIRYGIGLGFKFEDRIVTYANHDLFVKGYCVNERYASLVKDGTAGRDHHLRYGTPLGTFIITRGEDITEMIRAIPEVTFAWSSEIGYDIFQKDITKADAVEPVLEKLGIGWENVIAFGDAGNDTPFIRKAGIGVALGNAKDDVRMYADLVADTCVNDGVAKILEELHLV